MKWMERPLVGLDVETTGVDPFRDRVIEVAAVRCMVDSVTGALVVTHRFNALVNPGPALLQQFPSQIAELTGITADMLVTAQPFSALLHDLHNVVIGGPGESYGVPVAYNANFDRLFLGAECLRLGMDETPVFTHRESPWLDPLLWSRRIDKYVKGGHKLTTVAQRMDLRAEGDAHRAAHDAELAVRVLVGLYRRDQLQAAGNPLREQLPSNLHDALEKQEALYHEDRGELLQYLRKKRIQDGRAATSWLEHRQ